MAIELLRRAGGEIRRDLQAQINAWTPRSNLGRIVRQCFAYLPEDLATELLDRITSCMVMESQLSLVVFRHPESPFWTGQRVEDYGVVSHRVITNNGVDKLEDAFRNVFEPETFNFHAIGTGVTAEAVTDNALVTEWAGTDYTGGVRATGTQSAQAVNIYRTVGTNTKASAGTSAVTEHGIFSSSTQAAVGCWDRSVFTAVNLAQNDSLQSTYDGTMSAGG